MLNVKVTVNKCNIAIIVATDKLQTCSPEGAAVTIEYSRNSIIYFDSFITNGTKISVVYVYIVVCLFVLCADVVAGVSRAFICSVLELSND